MYAAPVRRQRPIGLDVTARVRMSAGEFLDRSGTPLLRPVADLAASWFAERPDLYFHDPLAAATVFEWVRYAGWHRPGTAWHGMERIPGEAFRR